jgi:hypothetical protein
VDTLIYFTGTDVAALAALSALARTLLAGTTTAAMQGTLGLGTAAVEAYTPGAFTVTATGMTTTITGTARYALMGKQVTLYLPTLSGTSNATTFTLTGIPAALNNATAQNLPRHVTDNGASSVGMLQTPVGGVMTVLRDPLATAWTASGVKRLFTTAVSYLLD